MSNTITLEAHLAAAPVHFDRAGIPLSVLVAELTDRGVHPDEVLAISRCRSVRVGKAATPQSDPRLPAGSLSICVVHQNGVAIVDGARRHAGDRPRAAPTVISFSDCSSFSGGAVDAEFEGGVFTIAFVSARGTPTATLSWTWRHRWFGSARAARQAVLAERDRMMSAIEVAVNDGRPSMPIRSN